MLQHDVVNLTNDGPFYRPFEHTLPALFFKITPILLMFESVLLYGIVNTI
ncbi:hypothetical protein GCM10026983_39340 [Gracilibacillus alcaliphilus]